MSLSIGFENVSKRYESHTKILDHLNLQIAAGKFCVVLGKSGCGKTTLLKMINRLVSPSQGSVYVDGKDVQSVAGHLLRRRIGYVFQGVGLFPHLTVAANISIVPQLLDWDVDKIQQRTKELMDMVRLSPSLGGRFPHELSGGQQQRVGFARALAAAPKIMLLDEPFGALDPLTRDKLQTELTDLQRKLGFTAVMVTHDMNEALVLADRIAVMQSGKILQYCSPRELLQNPASQYVDDLVSTPRKQAMVIKDLMADHPSK